MKLVIKTATIVLTLSIFTVGVASAMIPTDSLKKNLFPDRGVSSQVLSDIDSGVFIVRPSVPDVGSNKSGARLEPTTKNHEQLKGKHLI